MTAPSPIPDIRIDSRLYLAGLADLRNAVNGIGGRKAEQARRALWEAEIAHLRLVVEVKRLQLGIDVEDCCGR